MALRVWLPLNGTLENKGLSTLVPTGTPTFLDSGKIGKCISLTPRVSFTGMPRMDNFTILFWLKVDSCTSDWADSLSFTSIQADGSSASPFRFEATKTTRACSFHNNSPYAITTGSRILITEEQKGEWHHCGFSYDGEYCYTYIDGVLTYTDTGLGGYINDYFHIGETNNMVGGMNDLRIYDECLSQKQIKEISKGLVAHYKLEGHNGNPNLAKNTNTANLNTNVCYQHFQTGGSTRELEYDEYGIPCVKIIRNDIEQSGWQYLSYNNFDRAAIKTSTTYTVSMDVKASVSGTISLSGLLNGNATNYMTNSSTTINGTVTANQWNHLVFTCTTIADFSSISTTGQVIYWSTSDALRGTGVILWIKNIKLEEGNVATMWVPNINDIAYTALGYNNILTSDCSGNEYNLTMTGDLTYNEDSPRYESSTKFGGTCADYMYRPIFDFLTSPFTFNCWAYQTSATSPSSGNTGNTLQMIAGQGRDCGLAGFELCSANGYARLYLGTQTNGTYYTINDNTINLLNNWHMITGTFDGTIAKLYVDGVLKGTKESPIEPSWDQATGFVIGKMSYYYSSQSTAYFPFAGSISDVEIYATALSAEDILTMYKTSGIIDNKGNIYSYELNENDVNLLNVKPVIFISADSGAEVVYPLDNDYRKSQITDGTSGGQPGLKFNNADLPIDTSYKLSFCFKKISGTLNTIGGHCSAFTNQGVYIDGRKVSDYFASPTVAEQKDLINDGEIHYLETFLTKIDTTGDANLYIQINRNYGHVSGAAIELYNIKLEKYENEENAKITKNGELKGYFEEKNLNDINSSLSDKNLWASNSFIEI